MRKLGKAVKVRIGYQVDKDTLATTGWEDIEFYGFTAPADAGIVDDPVLGGSPNNYRDQSQGVRELPAGSCRLSVPLDLQMLPHWMRMAFGNTTSISGTGPYTYTFNSGADVLPFVTIQVLFASGDVGQYKGCMLDSFSVNAIKSANYQRLDLVFQCMSWIYTSALIVGGTAATARTARKMAQYRSTVFWGGVQMGDALEVNQNYGNGLDRYNVISGTIFPTEIDPGPTSVNGSLRVRLKDGTFRTVSFNDTAAALQTLFTHPTDPTNMRVSFQMNAARLASQGVSVDGPGPIDENFTVRGEQGGAGAAMTVVIKAEAAGAVYGLT